MSFDLNALAGKRAVVVVDYMGQSATLTYNPAVLTAENFNRSQTGGDASFVEWFTELVNDWDVKKGGKKVPLTQKGLEGVPLPFLRACMRQVMADQEPNVEEGKASNASSRRTGTTGKRRTGTN